MSVQINNYLLLGVKLPFESRDEWDKYQDSAYQGIRHHNGLCVLRDGMGGKYTFIGIVLAKSDEEGRLADEPIPIDKKSLSFANRRRVANLIHSVLKLTVEPDDIKLWIVTLYR